MLVMRMAEQQVGHVARRAGVSTSLVHYHFSSKAELITAALRSASEADGEYRRAIANRPGTALSRIDALLCGSMPERDDNTSWLLWIETWSETRRNRELRDVMAELDADEFALLHELVITGIEDGEFSGVDHEAATARLLAVRDGLATVQTLFDTAIDPGEYAQRLVGAICLEFGIEPADYHSALGRATGQ